MQVRSRWLPAFRKPPGIPAVHDGLVMMHSGVMFTGKLHDYRDHVIVRTLLFRWKIRNEDIMLRDVK